MRHANEPPSDNPDLHLPEQPRTHELPEVVAEQLPAVVADQLPGVVAADLVTGDRLADAEQAGQSRFNENKFRIDAMSRNADFQSGQVAHQLSDQHEVLMDQREVLAHLDTAFAKERKRTDHRMWFLFGLMMLAFLLLAARTEINAASIRSSIQQTAVTTWTNCQNLNVRAGTVNATNKAMVDVLSAMPSTPQLTKLIASYKAGILPIKDCGPRP